MKKYFFLTVCLALIGVSQAKAQAAKVALQHNGNVTLFNADELQKALDASVDGDTIYLNEGKFTGGVTIAKRISLIGAGQNTTVNGDVTISATGTFTARVLDALYITGRVILSGVTDGINIRKCKFYGFQANAKTDNAFIDRCQSFSDSFYINSNIRSMRVVNSIIGSVSGSASNVGDVVFNNCNIKKFYSTTVATFNNCVVRNNSYSDNSYFSYCLLTSSRNSVNESNCTYNTSLDTEGVYGSDGTVVGEYGGTTPYTLVPSVPTVTSYDLKVNTTDKRLNVNISVESK